jgi:hypothetical protein
MSIKPIFSDHAGRRQQEKLVHARPTVEGQRACAATALATPFMTHRTVYAVDAVER